MTTKATGAGAIALLVMLSIVISRPAPAQHLDFTPSPDREQKRLPLDAALYRLNERLTVPAVSRMEVLEQARLQGVTVRLAEGLVNVEIVNREGPNAVSPLLVARYGGEVDVTWRSRASVWVPPEELIALARALPSGFYMRRASLAHPDDEGPGVTGSDAYRDAGADGTGIRIAILDSDYSGLTNAQMAGVAPANYTAINYTGDPFEDDSDHGTGCVESAFDHAPGAEYFLYKITNVTHMADAVSDAIDSYGVDIISHSQSRYNEGWDDNSGTACAAVLEAHQNGVLFFTSAGNRAQQHWKGTFNSGSGHPQWHNWEGSSEDNEIIMPPNSNITFYLAWNRAGGEYDYDLYLFDASGTNVLASSTSGGETYEWFSFANTGMNPMQVALAVWNDDGGVTEFEVFGHGSGTWEYSTAASSITSPSNCTYANVVSVGAVDQNSFTSPSGTGGISMGYSSQGPTNSGNQAPDIAGPTNTTTVSNGGSFGGTSAATPNAAGAAAAFWSSTPDLSASGVRYLLFEQAKLFKDWGAGGTDYVYGHGGLRLHTYQANTEWADRDVGNTGGTPAVPWYRVNDAHQGLTEPGRIVFLGDTYPEPFVFVKEATVESIAGPIIFGE